MTLDVIAVDSVARVVGTLVTDVAPVEGVLSELTDVVNPDDAVLMLPDVDDETSVLDMDVCDEDAPVLSIPVTAVDSRIVESVPKVTGVPVFVWVGVVVVEVPVTTLESVPS